MAKLRFMNRDIFEKNLVMSLLELLKCSSEEIKKYKYVIIPVFEENKKYNSKDDFMRLTCFNERNLKNRFFGLKETVDLFSGLCPLYPLWIEVFVDDEENKIVVLRHSLRFRKPSQIQNIGTGHPPFRVVEEMKCQGRNYNVKG